jgi:ABC-2 type transport system permease protein
MSATSAAAGGAPTTALPTTPRRRSAAWSVYRVERSKLAAQLATRVLAVVCLLAPLIFGAVLKAQSGTPADALFGVWVHTSGYAVSLVVLGFAGSWGLPLLAGVLAGDMFSAEDRYGTWKTMLTRSCTRRDVFAGKLLAAAVFAVGLLALVALSSIVAGLVFVGSHPLVGWGGTLISSGHSLGLVVLSWVACVLPLLGLVSLALLVSVATGNGIAGVLAPALVALLTQLINLIGRGVWVHTLLIGSAFDGWHGLFASPSDLGPLAVASVVSLVWIAVCVGWAWRIVRRRDFAGVSVGRRAGWVPALRAVAVGAAVIVLLAVGASWGPVGVTAARLRTNVTKEFNNLTLLQQRMLGRPVPNGAQLNVVPTCARHATGQQGPGDWMCTLTVLIPQPGAVPFQQTPVTYDVSVQANGCYKAESPPSFVGGQTMRDGQGNTVVNPLFVFYGCFNPL